MKNLFKFFLLLVVVVCFAFAVPKSNSTAKSSTINVVIDAGHGGKDFGADYNDVLEKDITAALAKNIRDLNSNENVVLHFTRPDDNFVSLEERLNVIHNAGADLVISLHVNSAQVEKSGMELFVSQTNFLSGKSEEYAEKLSEKLKARHYNVAEVKKADMYLLKKSNVPAIIFEVGYLTDDIDAAYLKSDLSREQIAKTVLEFINEIKKH